MCLWLETLIYLFTFKVIIDMKDFPGGLVSKEFAYNPGDTCLVLG